MSDLSSENKTPKNETSAVGEPHFSYGPSEEEQLARALKRSYTERFKVMTKLMKMNLMFSKAKIIHQQIDDADKSE